jgi:long-chain acyl-CoA synthetase
VPEDLRVVDALPRNALSKLDRRALERMMSEDESDGSLLESAVLSHTGSEASARRVAER